MKKIDPENDIVYDIKVVYLSSKAHDFSRGMVCF